MFFVNTSWVSAGITNRVGGKQELAVLPETKTCTWEHLVNTLTYT
jgi:hypothetical protein